MGNIVSFKEALYLKEAGFNGKCNGYYDNSADSLTDEDRYECTDNGKLFKNSDSICRVAAPLVKSANKWYSKNNIIPFELLHIYNFINKHS